MAEPMGGEGTVKGAKPLGTPRGKCGEAGKAGEGGSAIKYMTNPW